MGAVLKPEAKDGEVTVVQVECEGYNSQEVAVPICAMKGGADLQRYLDVLIPSPPATLKIVRGEGPIHLVGSHCVDYYGFKDYSSKGRFSEEENSSEGLRFSRVIL